MSEQEKKIGEWRRSKMAPGYWGRSVATLGIYPLLLWRKHKITLTTHRVSLHSGGIIGSSETSISIENITDVSVDQSATGAILGYSAVRIQSAGSSAAEIAFNDLADADKLKNAIFDLKDGKLDGSSGDL